LAIIIKQSITSTTIIDKNDDDNSISKKDQASKAVSEMTATAQNYNPTFQNFILAYIFFVSTLPHLLTTRQSPTAVKAVGGMKLIA